MRRQRLSSRGIALQEPRNEAEAAAVAWACEMTALEAAAGCATVLWADFDRVLGDLRTFAASNGGFLRICGYRTNDCSEIARGPLTRRYSKAHGTRIQSRSSGATCSRMRCDRNRADIESALAMLDAAAETAPLLRKALDRAQAES